MRVGVDTGGTFTDCVVADGRGVRVIKVFSGSPASPEEAGLAIADGVGRLIEQGPAERLFLHPEHELTTSYLAGQL